MLLISLLYEFQQYTLDSFQILNLGHSILKAVVWCWQAWQLMCPVEQEWSGTGKKTGKVLVLLGLLFLDTKKIDLNMKLVDWPFEGMDVLFLL